MCQHGVKESWVIYQHRGRTDQVVKRELYFSTCSVSSTACSDQAMCQYGQGWWDLGHSSTQGPERAAGKETDLFQYMFCVQHTMCMDQDHSKDHSVLQGRTRPGHLSTWRWFFSVRTKTSVQKWLAKQLISLFKSQLCQAHTWSTYLIRDFLFFFMLHPLSGTVSLAKLDHQTHSHLWNITFSRYHIYSVCVCVCVHACLLAKVCFDCVLLVFAL